MKKEDEYLDQVLDYEHFRRSKYEKKSQNHKKGCGKYLGTIGTGTGIGVSVNCGYKNVNGTINLCPTCQEKEK